MAVYKRFNARKLKPGDPDWDKGTWYVHFTLRGHFVKQAIPEARTQKQAEQVEIQIKQAIFDRKYNKAGAVTLLSDFIDKVYVPWSRDNKRSYGDDKQRAEAARDFFGPKRAIRDITPMLIEKYKSHLRKTTSKYQRPFAPSTINRYLTVLSGVLSMAFANGIIDSNPMERVALLPEPEPRERYLNQHAVDEEERLFNALAPFGEHLVAMAELDLETGMRLGEMLRASWCDVNWQRDFLFIAHTKTDRPRKIPLSARAREILRALRQDAPEEERIFDPKRTGRRRRQLLYCFSQAVTKAGLDDFHFHDLRHTFATRLRAANVHEYDIADLLGHSTTRGDTRGTAITRGYAHGVPERLREAIDGLKEGKRIILKGWEREQARAG